MAMRADLLTIDRVPGCQKLQMTA